MFAKDTHCGMRRAETAGGVTGTLRRYRAAVHEPALLSDHATAPVDDGAASHLLGMSLPNLDLADTRGRSINLRSLGTGRTVLYIYPMTTRPDTEPPPGWDEIPGARGCTAESCAFRDHFVALTAAGVAQVFGLSRQDSDYQAEAASRLRLPFALLSDARGQFGEALRLPTFSVGDLTVYRRLTLIIRDGMVEKYFYPVFPPDQHPHEVLEWLRGNAPGI